MKTKDVLFWLVMIALLILCANSPGGAWIGVGALIFVAFVVVPALIYYFVFGVLLKK